MNVHDSSLDAECLPLCRYKLFSYVVNVLSNVGALWCREIDLTTTQEFLK